MSLSISAIVFATALRKFSYSFALQFPSAPFKSADKSAMALIAMSLI